MVKEDEGRVYDLTQYSRKEEQGYDEEPVDLVSLKKLPILKGQKAHQRLASVQGRDGYYVEEGEDQIDQKEQPARGL